MCTAETFGKYAVTVESIARQLGVAMPVTAVTRETLQAHFGAATLKPDPEAYLQKDFSALLETLALFSGVGLESENVAVSDGLEPEAASAPAHPQS